MAGQRSIKASDLVKAIRDGADATALCRQLGISEHQLGKLVDQIADTGRLSSEEKERFLTRGKTGSTIRHRETGEILFRGDFGSTESMLSAAASHGASLAGADLPQSKLAGTELEGIRLSGANLVESDFSMADLSRAKLDDADLARADLSRATLRHADLSTANLAGANLTAADLAKASLTGAFLTGANLYRANLAAADLTGADLARANLAESNLDKANLTGADLFGANLSGVDLQRTTKDRGAEKAESQKWLYEDYLTRGPVSLSIQVAFVVFQMLAFVFQVHPLIRFPLWLAVFLFDLHCGVKYDRNIWYFYAFVQSAVYFLDAFVFIFLYALKILFFG